MFTSVSGSSSKRMSVASFPSPISRHTKPGLRSATAFTRSRLSKKSAMRRSSAPNRGRAILSCARCISLLRSQFRGFPASPALLGMGKCCLANPRAVVPGLLAGGKAFLVHGPSAFDDAPEFIPVNRSEVIALPLLVPDQIGIGNLETDVVSLRNRGVDEFLAQLVIGETLDFP